MGRKDTDKDRDSASQIEDTRYKREGGIGFGESELNTAPLERDRDVFKRNLKLLWQKSGKTSRQLLKVAGIEGDDDWFRQWISSGLIRVNPVAEGRLRKLAKYFLLPSFEHFWSPDLVEVVVSNSGSMATDAALAKDALSYSKFYPLLRKCEELLESGEFPFLEPLIDKLHKHYLRSCAESDGEEFDALEFSHTAKRSDKPAAEAKSIADFMKKRKP